MARIVTQVSLDGVIATNTTVQRGNADEPISLQQGGLSGAPLHRLSVETIRTLRRLLRPALPIIGVGGIDSPSRALALRRAGADLVQIYTGLIYRGPGLVAECLEALK